MKKIFCSLLVFFIVVSFTDYKALCETIPLTEISQTTTESVDAVSYPMLISSDDYHGPECWLLYEPISTTTEIIFEIYTPVDISVDGWRDQVKIVLTFLYNQYNDNENTQFNDNENTMIKIYNGIDGLDEKQPSYEDLIAVWQSKPFSVFSEPKPTIIWYPNGVSVAAQTESENWEPSF